MKTSTLNRIRARAQSGTLMPRDLQNLSPTETVEAARAILAAVDACLERAKNLAAQRQEILAFLAEAEAALNVNAR